MKNPRKIMAICLSICISSSCYAQHNIMAPNCYTRMIVRVDEMYHQNIQPFALTSWYPNGNPYIQFGYRLDGLPSIIQQFTVIHETFHAKFLSLDEIAANCYALKSMRNSGLTSSQEEIIADWHISQGPIGIQYGGTGTEFWRRTIQCAGPNSNSGENSSTGSHLNDGNSIEIGCSSIKDLVKLAKSDFREIRGSNTDTDSDGSCKYYESNNKYGTQTDNIQVCNDGSSSFSFTLYHGEDEDQAQSQFDKLKSILKSCLEGFSNVDSHGGHLVDTYTSKYSSQSEHVSFELNKSSYRSGRFKTEIWVHHN